MKNVIVSILVIAGLLFAGILLTACEGPTGNGIPDPPPNLIVSGATENSITLAWTAVSGAASYKVFTSTTSVGVYTLVDETAYCTYIVNNLTPDSTFFYKVAAVNSKGIEGPQSVYVRGETSETVGPLPPPPPTGLTVTNAALTSISLSWTAVSSAAAYRIYTAVTSTSPNYQFVDETEYITYTVSGLAPNSIHYYRVSSVDVNGLEGQKSAYVEGPTTSPPSYTVKFDRNGGNGNAPVEQTVPAGSAITIPGDNGLSKSGYVFAGWNTNNSGTGINFPAGSSFPVIGNITLYAKWTGTVTQCTVTFDINGGAGNAPVDQTGHAGSVITTPGNNGLSKNGYVFGGWNTNEAGTGINYPAGISFTVTGDITLYAVWSFDGTIVAGSNLADKFSRLQSNALSNSSYLVEVTMNDIISPRLLPTAARTISPYS